MCSQLFEEHTQGQTVLKGPETTKFIIKPWFYNKFS